MTKKIICIIPARSRSKGIPGKKLNKLYLNMEFFISKPRE